MDRLFLLDASGSIYRAYFAIQALSGRQGEATNALYGFIRSYLRLKDDFHPEYLVAVFDGARNKEARTNLYADYKAHRQTTPPDLILQINEAKRFCDLMGIPTIAAEGVEADDTIGSITKWAKDKVEKIFICTQDKDLAQLVDHKTFVLNLHKDNLLIDEKKVEEIYGIPANQIVDYLAITGDASDNIPGLSGFGPKTAVQLLKQYGSLENILDHADEIGGKKALTIKSERDIALLSKRLVELHYNVDFPKDSHFFALKEPHWTELQTFFREKDFLSLLKIIPKGPQDSEDEKNKTACHIIEDEQALQELVALLSQQKELCIDTETTSEEPLYAELVGLGFSYNQENAYYVPVNGKIPKEKVLSSLRPLFENPAISFFGQNIKYDIHVLENAGIHLQRISFDTMLASYLLNAHQRRHSLDELALEYFGKKKIATSELIGTGKKQTTMDKLPIERVGEYCCEDVEYTTKLKNVLEVELKKRGLEQLLSDIEIPLIPILVKMEREGVYVDVHVLQTLSTEIAKDIAAIQNEIFAITGETFNLNSPKQLGEILFQKMLLPPLKRGKTALSTSAEVLEQLAINYPIARKILEYRSLEKLRSTYIDSLPLQINPKTHRIHCQFNQSVAATGRLSCQDPNLQNIPIRSEIGKKIREAFKPQNPSWSYLSADYSQIELRLLAHMTEDEGLLTAFEQGIDVHSHTAAKIFHIPIEEVTSEMRSRAKAVNFGVIYGQQAYGLSQELLIPMKEAATFIEEYYRRYPRVKGFIEHAKDVARKTGKAVTLTGRERLIPEIQSSNQILRSQAERLAVNTPLQGTAADIIKIAMLKIDAWMKKEKFKSFLVLQIHDELIFETAPDEIERLKEGVRHHMENVFELKVPLTVEISIGKNWKEC